MSLVATGYTFWKELQKYVDNLPEDVTDFKMTASGFDKNVCCVFHQAVMPKSPDCTIGRVVLKKALTKKDGTKLKSQELLELLKGYFNFPPDVTKFEINSKVNGIVMINITAALPLNSVASLNGCYFE